MTPQACATVVRSRSNRRPVSVERQPAPDMRQIHRDLACERHLGAPARRPAHILVGDTEHLHDGLLDGLARHLGRRPQPRRRRGAIVDV